MKDPKRLKITNVLRIILIVFFLLGVIFKFHHWPFGSVFLVLSSYGLLIISVGQIIEGSVLRNPVSLLFNLAFNMMMVFFMFRMQFWVGANFWAVLAFFLFIAAVIVKITARAKTRTFHVITTLLFIGMVLLYRVNAYKVYYVFNMTSTFHNEASDNPFAWDKYSFFLNTAGKKEAALAANHRAIKIAIDHVYQEELIQLLRQNRLYLVMNVWSVYEPLEYRY